MKKRNSKAKKIDYSIKKLKSKNYPRNCSDGGGLECIVCAAQLA